MARYHPSSDPNSPPTLSNTHLKALSPTTNWICNQIGGDPRCKCPDLPNPFFPHLASYKPEISTNTISPLNTHTSTAHSTPKAAHSPLGSSTRTCWNQMLLTTSYRRTPEQWMLTRISKQEQILHHSHPHQDQVRHPHQEK